MQGESQPKSNSPKCLGDAEFDCKYPEHVYLFYLALFILKKKNILGLVFRCAYYVHE
jgi:hypothetical protein